MSFLFRRSPHGMALLFVSGVCLLLAQNVNLAVELWLKPLPSTRGGLPSEGNAARDVRPRALTLVPLRRLLRLPDAAHHPIVCKVGPSHFRLSRRQWETYSGYAGKACVVPPFSLSRALKDGEVWGLLLSRVEPQSLLERMGLRNGDIIRRLNGLDLNDPERMLDVYLHLREATCFEVEVERGAQVLRLRYALVP